MLGTTSGPVNGDREIEEKIHSLDDRLASVESDLIRVIHMLSGEEEDANSQTIRG
jgi:hypothetical protein